jgi:signal transduction histidine kinase/anti-sigma regulatory factor (Ser/Thr protein kinase)
MLSEQQLKDELASLLENDKELNYSKILLLSNELAKFDKDNIRFSVDAGVIDRLGKELVARHETAVSELVKNAYDADALQVKIQFSNVDKLGGTLVIDDDGDGMTRDQLINGFMRISSTSKIHEPVSPIYKRSRAGKKGIGRFSTQRLGDKLTIISQTKDSQTAIKIVVDWAKYRIDDDIFFISNKIEEIPKKKEQGTTLIIEKLRDSWSETMIKRVYRYAIDVIQPFPLSKIDKSINELLSDPGFEILCLKDGKEVASQQSMIYEHAVAEIEGFVDVNGIAHWEIKNSRIPGTNTLGPQPISKEDKEENVKFAYLEGVKLRVYYFIYNVNLIPKQSESYILGLSEEYGGIRLYRNGFRVLPYGESQNDWLGLDESVRKRKVLPVHGNNNFFGFVEIAGSNINFQELSSREGLFNNVAYGELITFAYKAIISAVIRISSGRGIKITTGQKDWDPKYSRDPKMAIMQTADDLDKIADELEREFLKNPPPFEKEKGNDNSESENEQNTFENIRIKAKHLRDAVVNIEELNMIRVLAGLGLVIGEFTHEIMNYLGVFDIDTKYILAHLDKASEEYKRAERLTNTFDSFKVYASYFDETISQNVNQELRPIEIRDVIKPFIKTIAPDRERNNIIMTPEINGYDLFTCKMHTSEWASILFNLYSNSKKAIKRANVDNGQILVRAGKEDESIFVEFIDNGDGIPIENREKIFNAFFTTSSPKGHKASSTDELTGTGLGLKIVRDIIESYKGEISIENAPEGYSTNLRISIPIAKPEEIKDYEL